MRAVFLDRDDTLIAASKRKVSLNSTHEPPQLLPGVAAGLQTLKNSGFLLVVVTNQPQIGLGYPIERFNEINEQMNEALVARGAPKIDAIYWCACAPTVNCPSMKPQPGLLIAASQDLDVSMVESYCVGDSASDVVAGFSAGVKFNLLIGPKSSVPKELKTCLRLECVDDFLGAVNQIVRKEN